MMKLYITSIKRKSEQKKVYNFSVEEDESYVLNGIVSHNCRCRLVPVVGEPPEKISGELKDFSEWIQQVESA
jgi:hypothetical protein